MAAWQRFTANKPALFGAVVVVLAFMLAALGYWILPDNSPDANRQIPSLSMLKPWAQAKVLRIQQDQAEPCGLWTSWAKGCPDTYEYIPYQSVRKLGDTYVLGLSTGIEKTYPQANSQLVTLRFPLGSDKLGRCILSRLLLGTRVSLMVGILAVLISVLVGASLGLLAGYFGGKVDELVMFAANTLWSIPTLLLIMAIVMGFGRGLGVIFLAVGLTMWVDVARLVRGQVFSLKAEAFVEAAKGMGFSIPRILFRHILPNLGGPLLVVAAANFASAILMEAGLSYLGLGVKPPVPSWGNMLNEYRSYLTGAYAYLAILPGVAIMLLVLSFNLLGNGLRDAMDTKMK